jgi:hypothetical protein
VKTNSHRVPRQYRPYDAASAAFFWAREFLALFCRIANAIETFDQLLQATPNIPIPVIATLHDEHIAKLAVLPWSTGLPC